MFSRIEVIFLLSCCHAFNRTVVCRVPNQTKVLILVRGRALSTIVDNSKYETKYACTAVLQSTNRVMKRSGKINIFPFSPLDIRIT